jgi:hypothetical protein
METLDALVLFLSQFSVLTEIDLSFCVNLSPDVLNRILSALPKPELLTTLNLYYAFNLNDSSIRFVSQCLPALETLDIGKCYMLSDLSIQYLSKLPKLRRLRVFAILYMTLILSSW